MRWCVRGDVDGFFGLALDNFVQLLLIDVLCRFVLGFDSILIYGTILPGVAVSLVVGNVFYARQALQLARKTGRDDICALPYGINTPSLVAFVFLVMLPAKLAAEAGGAIDPGRAAWVAGIMACFGSGLIEFVGAFVAEQGVIAVALYIVIYATSVALSVPGALILTIAGGLLFGQWFGSVYVVFGATLGAIGVFSIAKTALGDALRRRAGPAIWKMEAGFQENALSYLLVLRLIPLFPFFLLLQWFLLLLI